MSSHPFSLTRFASPVSWTALSSLSLALCAMLVGCGRNDKSDNDDATADVDDDSPGDGDGDSDGDGDGDGDGDSDGAGGQGVGGAGTGEDGSGGAPDEAHVNAVADVGDGEFIRQVHYTSTGQLDLLFVIDNSVSMADKQQLLVKAVPQMLGRLTNPDCVNDLTQQTVPNPGSCPVGFSQEARAFNDIHIGVITSSLGGQGSDLCPTSDTQWDNDDQGHLLAAVRPNLPSIGGQGFLS